MSGVAWGPLLSQTLGIILILASMGTGITGQLGAARLVCGMGRDKIIPNRIFAYLDPITILPLAVSG
jgi:amino acid transporter